MTESQYLRPLLLAAALSASVAGIACAEHHSYRVYDSYHTDYHTWNHDEVIYYQQWSSETHRDSHRDFRRLTAEEQKEYWNWRHNHDHDRGHDHDHDRDHDQH